MANFNRYGSELEQKVEGDGVYLRMIAPCISYKATLRMINDYRLQPQLTDTLIKQIANDTAEDWLQIIALSMPSSGILQIEVYIAMAYLAMGEVKLRRERKACKGDEYGELFYRTVARKLQSCIDDEVEHGGFRDVEDVSETETVDRQSDGRSSSRSSRTLASDDL